MVILTAKVCRRFNGKTREKLFFRDDAILGNSAAIDFRLQFHLTKYFPFSSSLISIVPGSRKLFR